MVMPAVPAAMVPAVPAVMPMTVMMPAPAHLSGERLRILLHRRGRAGIDQRHCLRTLNRRRHDEKRAHSQESQNFRSDHLFLLHMFDFTSAPCDCTSQSLRRDANRILKKVT
jgi:hypothetical protein